jgi:hypothetical protein
MKNRLPKAILSAAVLAARMLCHGQSNVYSISIPSFAERSGFAHSLPARSSSPAPHQADEIRLNSYSHQVGSNTSCMEWYVSTNTLAKQPRWDGFSGEAPLSARAACVLALSAIRTQFPKVGPWSVESVQLRKPHPDRDNPYPDVWCYEVTLCPRDPEARERFDNDAATCPMQIVLLDGTVLTPRATKNE